TIHDPLAVQYDNFPGASHIQKLRSRGARSTGAQHDESRRLYFFLRDLQRIDDAGHHDDRGAMLIVVHHRNIERFDYSLFYVETFWRRDIFEIDPAKSRRDRDYGFHDFVSVLCI